MTCIYIISVQPDELLCIHCFSLQEVDEMPQVGAVLQCTSCKGFSQVKAHYLNKNGTVSMRLSKVPQSILDDLLKFQLDNR